VSAGAGLVIGGYIVDNHAWPTLFYSSVGLAAFGFVLVWLFVPPSKPAGLTGRIDFIGGILFILPVAGVMYALANVKAWGVLDERTLGLVAISALLLFAWVMYELRHKEPLLDIRLLANRQVALANISIVLAGLGSLQIYLVFSMFLQQPSWSRVGLGLTATVAGLMMLPSQMASVLSSPFSGWVAARFTARDAAFIGVWTMMIAWGGLFLHHSGLWYISGAILVAAIGLQIVYTALPNLIVEAVPENRTSEATGMLQVLRAASTGVGGLVVLLLMSVYIVSSPEAGSNASYPSPASYRLVFAFVFCCCFMMLLAVLALPRRKKNYEQRRSSPAVDMVYKR
jgi:MFS family permease